MVAWPQCGNLSIYWFFFFLILANSKVEHVIPINFPTNPTNLNTLSFYFVVDQPISLSLNLWKSLASHSPWVSFPLPSTTSMAITTSHRDRGTSFVAKLQKNDLHCNTSSVIWGVHAKLCGLKCVINITQKIKSSIYYTPCYTHGYTPIFWTEIVSWKHDFNSKNVFIIEYVQ